MEATDRELLKCDSKVLCGMLFGKVKQSQLHHIQLQISITGSFLHRSLSESDWVDLLGILLDNALEAASAGDLVFLRAEEEEGALCLLVSNPCPPCPGRKWRRCFAVDGLQRLIKGGATGYSMSAERWNNTAERSL